MVSIGKTTLPGASATVTSARSVGQNVSSPGDVAIVGGADPSATANPGEVYRITTPINAQNLFGTASALTQNCIDALYMGAFPVYAAAATEVDVAGEDISGIGSTSGTLLNGPLPELASAATFTVDSDPKTTILTLDDPSTKAPAAGEVYVNPVTAAFELDAAPSTSGTVDYTYHDYTAAVDAIVADYGDIVDFVGSTTENRGVVTSIESAVNTMEGRKQFSIAMAGAASYVGATADYVNPYDNSRIQLLFPARNGDGDSLIGSYLGLRAAIGIDRSAMKRRLTNQDSLSVTLTQTEKEDLDAANVVVLADETGGALVENDPTCVADGNVEEAEMKDSLSRLIVDHVTEIVLTTSESYIGGYHSGSTRNQLQAVLDSKLSALQETNAILDFNVNVSPVDAYTAKVELGVQTVKPLRDVLAAITAGEVDTGAVAISA